MTQVAHQVVLRRISDLKPHATNARTHSKRQIRQIADSLEQFGFTNPVLVSDDGEIVAGHGRVAAAKLLGLEEVPTLALSHLSPTERRAYVIADNKLALNAGWDQQMLAAELGALIDLDFDVSLTGFSMAEIDLTLDTARDTAVDSSDAPEDIIPEPVGPAVTRRGDIWKLGRHLLVCGDARSSSDFEVVLQGKAADIVFTDPPYNVPVNGHVCGLGRIRHREFAMAAGEMTSAQFQEFLRCTLQNAATFSRDGAIAFVCMDWRHAGELIGVGKTVFSELKNICVWNKTNGGMGAFYRSKHELVFVFKNGSAPHTNNFGLGSGGRYRTNVWDYPGMSSISPDRSDLLEIHPTVKPVALVADALRDCSRRGELVLDPFAGSGTTLIAAESCGRSARLIEYDPIYCDTVIRRFTGITGTSAIRLSDDRSFDELSLDPACESGDES
jgi:DNA modification methylase